MNAGEEFGGYTLLRPLGSGGAGTVWLAEDGGGAKVALKLLHPALASSEAARRRLEREAATVNSVRSDSVAKVVDIETEASQPFIASEYVPGPTLAAVLKEGPLDPRTVALLGEDIRRTIDAVHAARIVHRDIKPSNIICSDEGPVLIDFGIAMSDEDEHLTRTGLVSGTAGYTAPELLRGGDACEATDWWAWCATLLSASTGRPPFGSGDLQGVTMRVLTGEPDVEGLAPALAHSLALGLSPDPSARFSPYGIIDALRSTIDDDHGNGLGAVDWPTAFASKSSATTVLPADEAPGRTRTMPVRVAPSDPGRASAPSPARSDPPIEDPSPAPNPLSASSQAGGFGAAAPRAGATPSAPAAQWGAVPGAPSAWDRAIGAQAPAWAAPTPSQGRAWNPAGGGQVQAWGPAPVQTGPAPAWSPLPAAQAGAPPLPSGDAGYGGGMSAWPAHNEPPYAPRIPKTSWILGPALLMPLALLPILLGAAGSAAAALILVILSLAGASLRRREKRRVRNGGPKASDTAAMIAASPLMLLRALGALALGFAMGALGPYLAWVAYSSSTTGSPNWGLWPRLLSLPGPSIGVEPLIGDPIASASLWIALWAALVLTWFMPTSVDLRDGVSRFAEAVFGPLWVRFIAGTISAGVVIATWYILTGGLV